ncbi:MAG: mreD [Gammaproteobacteria bacterium]|jgi:rod shape-determining protein MreD|nr:mreD [Gammaproteobacteria bacterium]
MTYRLALLMLFSFLVASLLQFLPVSEVLAIWVPQWVALIIIYWALVLDERFKLLLPCFVGLCLDVMNGTILGQHALALLWVSFIVLKNGKQLRRAGRIQQMVEIGLLILGYQFILSVIQGVIGQQLVDWRYFAASLTSAIIWPWISIVLDDSCRRFVKLKEE